jgi:hypothetical protein
MLTPVFLASSIAISCTVVVRLPGRVIHSFPLPYFFSVALLCATPFFCFSAKGYNMLVGSASVSSLSPQSAVSAAPPSSTPFAHSITPPFLVKQTDSPASAAPSAYSGWSLVKLHFIGGHMSRGGLLPFSVPSAKNIPILITQFGNSTDKST